MPSTQLLLALTNGVGLMALVAMLYGSIERLPASRPVRSLLQGFTFGVGAVLAMMSPVVVVPGVLADARAIFIALAGAFVGPVAAVAALVVAGSYRVWLGGVGMPIGVATLLLSLAVGLAWRYAWFHRRAVTPAGLLLLGLGISSHALFVPLLPIDVPTSLIVTIGAALMATSLLATPVLGAMINRENRLIAREKSLIADAYTDALTRLPNRRALYGAEAALLAASARRGFVVLMLDIDHFKAINDRFGHDAGDAALCILSDLLRSATRTGDLVARFGGEEFVIILPDTRQDEGRVVAERVIAQVRERRIMFPEAEFQMTVSVGMAHARNAALVGTIARADEALYRAKAEGRDRIVAAAVPSPQPSAADVLGSSRSAVRRVAAQRAP